MTQISLKVIIPAFAVLISACGQMNAATVLDQTPTDDELAELDSAPDLDEEVAQRSLNSGASNDVGWSSFLFSDETYIYPQPQPSCGKRLIRSWASRSHYPKVGDKLRFAMNDNRFPDANVKMQITSLEKTVLVPADTRNLEVAELVITARVVTANLKDLLLKKFGPQWRFVSFEVVAKGDILRIRYVLGGGENFGSLNGYNCWGPLDEKYGPHLAKTGNVRIESLKAARPLKMEIRLNSNPSGIRVHVEPKGDEDIADDIYTGKLQIYN